MRTGCRNTNVVVAKNATSTLVQDDANCPKIVLLNINSEGASVAIAVAIDLALSKK